MSETSTERYERLAEAFYNATGKIAPGKDVPAEMGGDDLDERAALWRVFIAGVNLSEPAPQPSVPSGEREEWRKAVVDEAVAEFVRRGYGRDVEDATLDLQNLRASVVHALSRAPVAPVPPVVTDNE